MKKSFPILLSLFAIFALPFKAFAVDLTAIQEKVSDYLPYVLIGGAVILLISIIGILLGKKKDQNVSSEPIVTAQPITPQAAPAEEIKIPEVEEVQEPTPTVNMDTISNNLYSPAPEATSERPTIQETLESAPQAVSTQNTQSSDLQAVLQGEAAAAPMTPVTNQVTTPMMERPAPTVENTLSPITETTPIPPIDTTSNPVPDLQQFVNNQVAEVPPMTPPVMETPAPTETATPTQTDTPISDI